MKIAFSQFFLDQKEKGNTSTYSLPEKNVIQLVECNWGLRIPGTGETGLDRKVLVPVPPEGFYCPWVAKIAPGLPIKTRVVQRQTGEDYYLEHFITKQAAKKLCIVPSPAKAVSIVCYSAEALLENGGNRSSNAEWEIVAILATKEEEPIVPLTMARNFLSKPGGTFTNYTAEEFAKSIYYHATNRTVKVC